MGKMINHKPFKLGPYINKACIVIELLEVTITSCNLRFGDELEIYFSFT